MPSNPDTYNPIENVGGVFVHSPATYQGSYQDVSDADAGRTEDGLMHKNMIGTKVKIQLGWNYLKDNEISTILQAFSPEYFQVKYKDPMTASFQTKTFYCGDKATPAYNSKLGIWSVSFNIIER